MYVLSSRVVKRAWLGRQAVYCDRMEENEEAEEHTITVGRNENMIERERE